MAHIDRINGQTAIDHRWGRDADRGGGAETDPSGRKLDVNRLGQHWSHTPVGGSEGGEGGPAVRRWVIATWSRRECAGGVRRECEAAEIGLKIPVGGRRKCGQGRRSRTDKFPKAPQRHKTEGQMTDNSGSPLRWQTPQSGAWGDADQQRPGGNMEKHRGTTQQQ